LAGGRRAGIALLSLSLIFFVLALLAAFTIFGDLAVLLAVGCAVSGAVLLSRAGR
jgi:hypothetical protein